MADEPTRIEEFDASAVVSIRNGIHLTPITNIARFAFSVKCSIALSCGERMADSGVQNSGEFFMSLYGLGACAGATVDVKCVGEDAVITGKKLLRYIAGFEDGLSLS